MSIRTVLNSAYLQNFERWQAETQPKDRPQTVFQCFFPRFLQAWQIIRGMKRKKSALLICKMRRIPLRELLTFYEALRYLA